MLAIKSLVWIISSNSQDDYLDYDYLLLTCECIET